MTIRRLIFPSDIQAKIARYYQKFRGSWLSGDGQWPLIYQLGAPKEVDANNHADYVRSWVSVWQAWQGAGELIWKPKQWRVVGDQKLPSQLILTSAREVTAWLGETSHFDLAQNRYQHFLSKWPPLRIMLTKHFDKLASYSDRDICHLETLLEWLLANPRSNLYPRQLPVAGIDSKWLELHKSLLAEFVSTMKVAPESDFYALLGLKQLPRLIRFRILDQGLREKMSGLEDITTSDSALATLDIPITNVFIVENIQTGLAFTDIEGAIVIFGLGYHVDGLFSLPWLVKANCYYWGDIDTHGFAILNRARSYLPNLRSILMDDATLHQHQSLWGREDRQHEAKTFPHLTAPEQKTYASLKTQHWGENVRLEQEKIEWDWAWNVIASIL
jgi:hypothetical protein